MDNLRLKMQGDKHAEYSFSRAARLKDRKHDMKNHSPVRSLLRPLCVLVDDRL